MICLSALRFLNFQWTALFYTNSEFADTSMYRFSQRAVVRACGFAVPLSSRQSRLRCGYSSQLCHRFEARKPRPSIAEIKMQIDGSTPSTIQVGGYKFYGVSIAAVQTCICVPSLSLAFDAGKSPSGAIPMKYMAISHGHCDHVHGLPLHLATRSLQKLPPATYFVPAEIEADIRNLIDAVGKLEGSVFSPNLVPLTPESDEIELKKGFLLKTFRTSHTVPSLGYVVYKRKKKLKADFVGIPGSELAHMRKSGLELDDFVLVPEIAFTGDTRLEAIAESEVCRKARILITELTFLDNTCSSQDARAFGHIHIEEVIEKQHIFRENHHVIFTHFSARYSREDILAATARLPDGLREKSVAFGCSNAVIT